MLVSQQPPPTSTDASHTVLALTPGEGVYVYKIEEYRGAAGRDIPF